MMKQLHLVGWGLLFTILVGPAPTQAYSKTTEAKGYSSLFREEVLQVTTERDGYLEGTLRAAIIGANGIRSQHPYTTVKILFAPQVRRIQITKGSLPALESSLTTLDCFTSQGKVMIEYLMETENPEEDSTEHEDNSESFLEDGHVLTIRSNNNTVRGCQLVGAKQAGLAIHGNNNLIELNTFGFLNENTTTGLGAALLRGTPQGNQTAGLFLGEGAHDNKVQQNDFVANNGPGIWMHSQVGTGNQLSENYFSKNQGKPIQADPNPWQSKTPSIEKINSQGDQWVIQGTCSPGSLIQLYEMDPEQAEVGPLVMEAKAFERTRSTRFEVNIPKNAFTSPALGAVAQQFNQNTSEFSQAYELTESQSQFQTNYREEKTPGNTPSNNNSSRNSPTNTTREETVIDLFPSKGP